MTRKLLWVLALLSLAGAVLASAASASTEKPRVLAIKFGPDLEINPVTQDWFDHQLDRAANNGYDAAVVLLDTPGGLSSSMKKMYQHELALKIPVIVYVSPEGSRAASAGVWISEAADVLAMAPTTNIGSSTPIDSSGANLGSDLRRKVINDAAASLSALAATHQRNAAWPQRAVRVASNLTAEQALKMNVIDTIAPNLPALLTQLDGYRTKDAQRPFTLHLGGAQIDTASPGFFTRLLNTLIDPNLLTLLFLAGIAGIGFEIFHPGIVLPGALGAVALLTALFGFSVLPISWAGLALLLFGATLLGLETHFYTHGTLAIAGIISLTIGALMLFHNAPAPYHTSVPLVLSITIALGAFWVFAISRVKQVRRKPPATGAASMVGEHGIARSDGTVFVNGELWRARTAGDAALRAGDAVEIAAVEEHGLTLVVRPPVSAA